MNEVRAVLLLLAVNFTRWFGEQTGSCTAALETLKATAVTSTPQCLTWLLRVFLMPCWMLRCLLQDSVGIPVTSCAYAVDPLAVTQGEFLSCAYT